MLWQEMVGRFMRVFIPFAMTQSNRIPVCIHQMLRHIACAFIFDQLEGFEVRAGGIGLGRGCQVKGGFHNWVDPFGHADIVKSLGSCTDNDQTHRVAQPDILTR